MTATLDLVSPSEIADRLHVTAQAVPTWRKRTAHLPRGSAERFPDPVFVFSRVPVWHWQAVRSWASVTGRLEPSADVWNAPAISARELETIRAAILAEIEPIADAAWSILERESLERPRREAGAAVQIGARGRGNRARKSAVMVDQRGSAGWDWYYDRLTDQERTRIARDYCAPDGLAPDQLADILAEPLGCSGAGLDDVMEAWLACTRIAGAARCLARRYVPSPMAYGALTLSELFPDQAATFGDLAAIFGSRGRHYIAEQRAREAEQVAELTPRRSCFGLDLLDLSFEAWREEITDILAELGAADYSSATDDRGVNWGPSAAVQALEGRLADLLPGDLVDQWGALAPEDLYCLAIGAVLAEAV